MPQRPSLRDLLVRELDRIDFERRAVLSAIAALAEDHPRPPRRYTRRRPRPAAPASPTPRSARPKFAPHKGSRKLRADLYDATLAVVRDAPGAIKKPDVRRELTRRGQPTTSVDYHLIRAVDRGDLKRTASGYIPRHA